MSVNKQDIKDWSNARIKQDQVEKYMKYGKDFIDDDYISSTLDKCKQPDKKRIRDIIEKSLNIKTLNLEEAAYLINVQDESLLREMQEAALSIKKKVYDNRIVTFAPLYLGNFCVNDCLYCGFRRSNKEAKRKVLSLDEVKKEI
jgi:2-iminoacetate synthase